MGQSKTIVFCRDCGTPLPFQKTGRPRIRCDGCNQKTKKHQDKKRYLNRKYPGNNETERCLKDHQQFKNKILKGYPELSVIFNYDLAFKERERISKFKRKIYLRALAVHIRGGGNCHAPLDS